MIYVRSGGGRYPMGLGLFIRRWLFRLGWWLVRLSNLSVNDPTQPIRLYNLDAESAAIGFNPETRHNLKKAAEDFEAAARGLRPIHASYQGGFLDGGTSTWQGDGYTITLLKSLSAVGDIQGYMFGPVLKLDYPLAHGNTTEISRVTFYTMTALENFLGQ